MTLPAILKDNLRLPVIGAPLFIISHPPLVLEQCKAGIVGSFPALNARPEAEDRRPPQSGAGRRDLGQRPQPLLGPC